MRRLTSSDNSRWRCELSAVACAASFTKTHGRGSPASTGWPEETALHASAASSHYPSCPVSIYPPNRGQGQIRNRYQPAMKRLQGLISPVDVHPEDRPLMLVQTETVQCQHASICALQPQEAGHSKHFAFCILQSWLVGCSSAICACFNPPVSQRTSPIAICVVHGLR